MKIKSLFAAVGVVGLLVSSGASADWDWFLSGSGTKTVLGPYASTGGTPSINATVTAWANPPSSSSNPYGAGDLEQINMTRYGSNGWGAGGGNSPRHAFGNGKWTDSNNSRRIESALLSFSSAVELSSVQFGWRQDGDFTVAAFTGDDGAANNHNLAGQQYATLADHGWTTVGNYYNPAGPNGSGLGDTTVNIGGISSSYWLISALNPQLGSIDCCAGNDYFKLTAFSAKYTPPPPGVPEPSTLSLLLVGLLLAGYLSSQKRQRAAGRLAA